MNAYEIESAALDAVGVGHIEITSQEKQAALPAAIRLVVFKADVGQIEIEFLPGIRIAEGLATEVLGEV